MAWNGTRIKECGCLFLFCTKVKKNITETPLYWVSDRNRFRAPHFRKHAHFFYYVLVCSSSVRVVIKIILEKWHNFHVSWFSIPSDLPSPPPFPIPLRNMNFRRVFDCRLAHTHCHCHYNYCLHTRLYSYNEIEVNDYFMLLIHFNVPSNPICSTSMKHAISCDVWLAQVPAHAHQFIHTIAWYCHRRRHHYYCCCCCRCCWCLPIARH